MSTLILVAAKVCRASTPWGNGQESKIGEASRIGVFGGLERGQPLVPPNVFPSVVLIRCHSSHPWAGAGMLHLRELQGSSICVV